MGLESSHMRIQANINIKMYRSICIINKYIYINIIPSHQRSSASFCTYMGSPMSISISSRCRGINLCKPRCVGSKRSSSSGEKQLADGGVVEGVELQFPRNQDQIDAQNIFSDFWFSTRLRDIPHYNIKLQDV